jgi:hypothetical protein
VHSQDSDLQNDVSASTLVRRRKADSGFLQRVFHKLLMNYTWWINRKDSEGHNVFEDGFLGLDNISVFDRSQPLPPGYSLKQADATGWMAMFAMNLTIMALEITTEDPDYEDIAIQTYAQFLAIANTIGGHTGSHVPLWDAEAGFFKDPMVGLDGRHYHTGDVLFPASLVLAIYRRRCGAAPHGMRRGAGNAGMTVCAVPPHICGAQGKVIYCFHASHGVESLVSSTVRHYWRKGLMHIRVGYEFIYTCPQPTPMILTVHIHFTRVSDLIVPDHLITHPSIPITAYRDAFGNWCSRIVAPPGQLRLAADFVHHHVALITRTSRSRSAAA